MSDHPSIAFARVFVLSLALGLAGGLSAQQPGDQLRRTLPETEAGEKEDDRVFKNWIRLQRAGSASDRLNQRRRMIGHGKRFLPQLMSTLTRRNQFDLRQVLLVLLELRAEEAYDGLAALAAGRRGGVGDWAALALGKLGLPRAEGVLEKLIKEGKRVHRPAAFLAVGLIGAPTGGRFLNETLRLARADLDETAILLGMGMGGWSECQDEIRRYLTVKKDRLRRAATAALGLSTTVQSKSDLMSRLKDEDDTVRRIALEGLAWGKPGPDVMEAMLRARVLRDGNTDVVVRGVLLLGRIADSEALARLQKLAGHRLPEVRAAVVAASLGFRSPRALGIAQRAGRDPHIKVRRVAFLVRTAQTKRTGTVVSVLVGAQDPDQVMRETAILGHVYLLGRHARKGLIGLQTRRHRKDVRELSGKLIALIDAYPPAASSYARARLQTHLDQLGVAASWNLNHSVEILIRRVLLVENARARGGAGAAPGGPSAAERQGGRRPPPHREDLYLHLESWPYHDARPFEEMPAAGQ